MTSEGAAAQAENEAAARLCLSCGLCCDGSFFGSVELRAEDHVAELGQVLQIKSKEGKLGFSQPCAALRGRCCAVYENRPQVCRRYRCRVLRAVQTNVDGLPEALENVARLRGLVASLKTALRDAGYLDSDQDHPAALKTFRAAYAAALAAEDSEFFVRHGELILRWKKTAWLMHEKFDEKAAARLALPVRET